MKKIVVCALAALLLCGCYDYKDLGDYLFVSGISVDLSDGGYDVGIEITSSSKDSLTSEIIKSEGRTVGEAINLAFEKTSGRFFLEHCRVVIISEETANKGIADLAEGILRYTKIQNNTRLLVAKDCKAIDILTSEAKFTHSPSLELSNALDFSLKSTGYTMSDPLYKISTALHDGKIFMLPVVYEQLIISGCMVFNSSMPLCYLSDEETLYYTIALGKSIKSSVFIPTDGGLISENKIYRMKNTKSQRKLYMMAMSESGSGKTAEVQAFIQQNVNNVMIKVGNNEKIVCIAEITERKYK